MILASDVLSQYTRVTDDRQHLMAIAEFAMQLQRSAKNDALHQAFAAMVEFWDIWAEISNKP